MEAWYGRSHKLIAQAWLSKPTTLQFKIDLKLFVFDLFINNTCFTLSQELPVAAFACFTVTARIILCVSQI